MNGQNSSTWLHLFEYSIFLLHRHYHYYTPMAEHSLSLAPINFQAPKMSFRTLHCRSSIAARIHIPGVLGPFPRRSFPFTHRSFSTTTSPLSVDVSPRVRRRFAVPRDNQEREGSSFENEIEIDNEVQENEQLLGIGREELGIQGLLSQMKEIVTFTGPAIGLWICGPLMSLIDTAVIGQGSAVELAALGILVNFSYFCFFSDSC